MLWLHIIKRLNKVWGFREKVLDAKSLKGKKTKGGEKKNVVESGKSCLRINTPEVI